MRDSTEKSPSVDAARDHCLEVRTDANNDEVKVQKERILPGENRFRAGTH